MEGRFQRLLSTYQDDLVIIFVAGFVYLITLAPTVTTGDSGELITAAATLGVAHPTGYPLYILLGRIFMTPLFFLSPALAMNLFSAVMAVAACLAVRRLVLATTSNRYAALTTALLFAFTYSLWSQATTARVYTLNAFLVSMALLEIAKIEKNADGSLLRAWFFFGLGMANHTITILLFPILLFWTLKSRPNRVSLTRAFISCIPGLALYLYIPIAASFNPYQNWGNPSNLPNLIRYLSREGYWGRRYVEDVADLVKVFGHYIGQIPAEFTWPGVLLILAGMIHGFSKARFVLFVGLYLFVGNILMMALHGSRSDIFYWPRYMITGWIGLSMIAGLGLWRLMDLVRRKGLILFLVGAFPLVALISHFQDNDRSKNFLARDFAMKILEAVEDGSIIFAEGDNVLFPLIYLHHVEGVRPDVTLVLQGVNELKSMVIDPDRVPIYFTHYHNLGSPQLELVPDGLLFRLIRAGSKYSGRAWDYWAIPSFEAIRDKGHLRYLDRNLVGDYLELKALHYEKKDIEKAVAILKMAMDIDFDNTKTFTNAGLLLERNLRFEEALAAFETVLRINPKDELAIRKTSFWRTVLASLRGISDPEERSLVLATKLFEAGRSDLSVGVLYSATRAIPTSFKLHYNLAAVLISRQAFEEAANVLEKALVLKPDDQVARRDLEQVRRILKQGEGQGTRDKMQGLKSDP